MNHVETWNACLDAILGIATASAAEIRERGQSRPLHAEQRAETLEALAAEIEALRIERKEGAES